MTCPQEPQISREYGPAREGGSRQDETDATVQPSTSSGCTKVDLAEAKALPLTLMEAEGWSDIYYLSKKTVRIPYKDVNDEVCALR